MGMHMNVAYVHQVKHRQVGVHGYDECQDFIDRLDNYANLLEWSGTHENGYGEGWMEHEIELCVLRDILEQDDEWFVENGCLEDKAIIQTIYDNADKNEDTGYAYISCH